VSSDPKPCEHGRADGRCCPYCLGIDQADPSDWAFLVAEYGLEEDSAMTVDAQELKRAVLDLARERNEVIEGDA
jgi:hypothetical protein